MSRISFAPLDLSAIAFLMARVQIDYSHCDFSQYGWFCCCARKGTDIQGVFIAEFINPYEAHATCALDDPSFLTRRLLKAIFTALFSQAARITFMTRPENEKAIRIIEHLGAKYEGYCRRGIEGRYDGLVFGLLREECRYLGQPRKLIEPKPDSASLEFFERRSAA